MGCEADSAVRRVSGLWASKAGMRHTVGPPREDGHNVQPA